MKPICWPLLVKEQLINCKFTRLHRWNDQINCEVLLILPCQHRCAHRQHCMIISKQDSLHSYYLTCCIGMTWHHTINRAAFVCLSVCLFVPYLLRGPLTDLRQTWWVYVGGPRNCPWGVLFRKGQRLDGSTGHFHFPLYYICTSLMPHAATAPLACSCRV